jgi:hypothetical protein
MLGLFKQDRVLRSEFLASIRNQLAWKFGRAHPIEDLE